MSTCKPTPTTWRTTLSRSRDPTIALIARWPRMIGSLSKSGKSNVDNWPVKRNLLEVPTIHSD
jgi:hypothetical protein